ncbi:MAG: DUF3047 domain-containing protein [Methylococcaceae bacterium]
MNTVSDFKNTFTTLLNNAQTTLIEDFSFLTLPCNQKPWLNTAIKINQGDSFSSFAIGHTELIGTSIQFNASFQLWFRISLTGDIFRGTRDSHSFIADNAGDLYVASYFPAEWTTKTGDIAIADEAYQLVSGEFEILLIRWQTNPLTGLLTLFKQSENNPLIALEIERLQTTNNLPKEWSYLWFLGPAEIYQYQHNDKPIMCCHTHKDCGLLQKDIDLSFKEQTYLHWSWKIEQLPSAVREDTLATHDYLSIAVEFDNGQDITYYWSAELEPETAYRCPIPSWHDRETHVVIRSGMENLGEWFDEQRDIYADYQRVIGGVMPNKIVRIWLIAVSLFQQNQGDCQYAGIRFLSDNIVTEIL